MPDRHPQKTPNIHKPAALTKTAMQIEVFQGKRWRLAMTTQPNQSEKQRVIRQLKGLLEEIDSLEAVFAETEDELGLSRTSADMRWNDRIARIEAARAAKGL
jgi:hypothetical protein